MRIHFLLLAAAAILASNVKATQSFTAASSPSNSRVTGPVHNPCIRVTDFENFILPVPGYAFPEAVIIYTPSNYTSPPPPGEKYPLLVLNHRFNFSHQDVIHTRFPQETCAKGWILASVLANNPFGRNDLSLAGNNYGSVTSQEFATVSIDFVLDNYPIDMDRIYGVGFSMGGAQCMSYAARHQDPDRGMFAALVNHTGSVDQTDTWFSATNSRPSLNNSLQGTPFTVPFEYRRSSIIEIDQVAGSLVNMEMAFAQNLIKTPTQIWMATQDPLSYLTNQTTLYSDFLAQQPGSVSQLNSVASVEHEWDTIDYPACLDFLEQYSLVIPNERRVIADRDGRWLYFDVSGIPAETFAAFDYHSDLESDQFTIRNGESFSRIETDLARWNDGVPHPLPFRVTLDFAASDTEVVFSGLDGVPMTVARNGISQATGWSYDAATQTLVITEPDSGEQSWAFLP